MEDSVGEEERREQGEKMAQPKAHQEEEVVAAGGVGGCGGEPAQDGGFLSAMASKIGATMSGANGSGGEANAAAASDGEAPERDDGGEPGEEGGFLSAMASKIGAAMSGANGGSESDGGGAAAAVASHDEGKEKHEGDGGGGIFHKLLSSSHHSSSPASGALETEEVKGEEKGQGVADEQAGILSTMASKIGMAMSGANGNGNHGTEDGTETSNGHAVDGSNGEEKGGDGNGGGGILNAMASKIGMAVSGANGDEDHEGSGVNAKTVNDNAVDGSKDDENREETNGGGGILSAVASKIGMAVSGANGNGNHSTDDGAKTSNGDIIVHGSNGQEEEKKGRDASGAGIVEQIISNLPSEDQAPDYEEASLLIAIIED
ncbi:unnamed protein product [Urochloa decumbens]|uniref:Uncharacterized protein n=1 Tax=Urochloa decumbens TaxID=240449 RepID=A0ABC8WS71_9POAL